MFELSRIKGLRKSRTEPLGVERMEDRALLSTPGIGPISVLPHAIPAPAISADFHHDPFPGHHHHHSIVGNPSPTPTPPTPPPSTPPTTPPAA